MKDYKRKAISWWRKVWYNSPFVTSLAIDLDSISNIHSGGNKITPAEIMKLYRDCKTLFYKGNPPIVLKKGLFSKVKLKCVSDMSEEEKKELIKKLS